MFPRCLHLARARARDSITHDAETAPRNEKPRTLNWDRRRDITDDEPPDVPT
jgi:hypothetical protein